MIDEIVVQAEDLKPIALIGPGGIGKTSIALKVLHHDRIKQRFGDDRRFIRCDQFPPSCAHLLSRLSKVIGAGIENPENLASLRPFLSSREMLIVLDNAESILDPQGTEAEEIYAMVEELGQFDNISLLITSRISTIPSDCEILEIPTLSSSAARETFYGIHKKAERSDLIDEILDELDFHPLSIMLLATVALQNKWGTDRLAREWEQQRTGMLQTMHNKSLARTIELSLASPLFQELGPDARGLLEVVAFFPQGVDESNLGWLFPTIPNGSNIFDKFCVLSLTYRNDSFITMLAPLRDHLCPKDPLSCPLLCMTKERYFIRMPIRTEPDEPGSQESWCIVPEVANVEHLLNVFTTIDASSDAVWDACANFISRLAQHTAPLTILGPKIEGLPDDHRSKSNCLVELAHLFHSVGNRMECKRLLTHALRLDRERGDDRVVARTLMYLSEANVCMGLHEEGIKLVEEASEIHKRLGAVIEEAWCLRTLARTLQPDAAEEAVSRAMILFSEGGDEFQVCDCYHALGRIYLSRGETEKAVHHFKLAIEMASPPNWNILLFSVHYDLAMLFFHGGSCDDAQAHIDSAKPHAVDRTYDMGRVMELQARLWYRHHRLEEAKAEALCAADAYERIGATSVGCIGCFLQLIEEEMNKPELTGFRASFTSFVPLMFLCLTIFLSLYLCTITFRSSTLFSHR